MGVKKGDQMVHASISFDLVFDIVARAIAHSGSALNARLSLMAAAEYIAAEYPTLDKDGNPPPGKMLRKAAKGIQEPLREAINERRDSFAEAASHPESPLQQMLRGSEGTQMAGFAHNKKKMN